MEPEGNVKVHAQSSIAPNGAIISDMCRMVGKMQVEGVIWRPDGYSGGCTVGTARDGCAELA